MDDIINPKGVDDLTAGTPNPDLPQDTPRVQAPPPAPSLEALSSSTPPPSLDELFKGSTNTIPAPAATSAAVPSLSQLAGEPEQPPPSLSTLFSGEQETVPGRPGGKAFADVENSSGTLFGSGHAETVLGHFGAGLNKGVRGLGSAMVSLAGMGIGEAENIAGVTTNKLSDSFYQYADHMEKGGPTAEVQTISDLSYNPISWLKYAAEAMGEGVPFLLSMLAGGAGVGGIMGTMATRGVAMSTRSTLLRYAPAMLNDARAVGGLATAMAIETGTTAKQIYDMTGDTHAIQSVLAGTVKGLIDLPMALYLGRLLGGPGGASQAMTREILHAAGVAGLGMEGREAVNMGVQSIHGEAPTTEEAITRMADAGLKGFLTGGVFGAAHKALTPGEPVGNSVSTHDLNFAAEEMGTTYGTLPDAKVNTSLDQVFDAIRQGDSLGTSTVANHMGLDEVLSKSDARSGDYLFAVKRDTTTENLGIQDANGNISLMHEGKPLDENAHAKVDPATATALTVDGNNTTFGSQDYALQDAQRTGRTEYVQLNKNSIQRSQVTAGIEDLPSSLNDTRITLPADPVQRAKAARYLGAAIETRNRGMQTATGDALDVHLTYSEHAYRLAIQAGARVEPLRNGTVRLRDESTLPIHTSEAAKISPTISSAKFAGGKQLNDKTIAPHFTMEGLTQKTLLETKSKEKADTISEGERLRDKAIDLSTVHPDELTAYPSEETFNNITASKEIYHDFNLEKAARVGIIAPTQGVLRRLVNLVMNNGPEQRMSETKQRQFLDLVNDGLRLRVVPSTEEFIMLRNLNRRELIDVGQRESPNVDTKSNLIEKPRQGNITVMRNLEYEHPDLKDMYIHTLRGSTIQTTLSGYVGQSGYESKSRSPKMPDPADSIGGPLQRIMNTFGFKGKIVIRIMSPKTQKIGMVVGKEPYGKNKEMRTVVKINPWFYARETQGRMKPDGTRAAPRDKSNNRGMKNAGEYEVTPKSHIAFDEQLAEFWADLGNSMGHVIYEHEFSKLPEAKKDLLREAFNRERTDTMTFDQGAKVARTMAHPLVQREVDALNRTSGNHQLDFEKWLVNGVGRHFSTDPTIMGQTDSLSVKKGSRDLLERIDKVIRKVLAKAVANSPQLKAWLGDDPMQGKPAPAIKDFIDSLQTRFNETQKPLLEDATRLSAVESRIAAQSKLNDLGLNHVLAQPEKASSLQLRAMLKNNILDPKLDAEAIKRIEGLLGMGDRMNVMFSRLLGIHELGKANPGIKDLQAYLDMTARAQVRRSEWTSLADERVRQWTKLGKNMAGKLSRFMFDYDSMSYLDKGELKKGNIKPRRPTAEELMVMVKAHGINKEAFDVFRSINKDFLQFLGQLEKTTYDKIDRTITDPKERRIARLDVQSQMMALRSRPYFPHMRFGKYLLTVSTRQGPKGGAGKVVHFEGFESAKDRDAGALRLLKEYPPAGHLHEMDVASEVVQNYLGLPDFALKAAIKELGLDKPELTPQQRSNKKVLETAAIKAAPVTSFRKSMLTRGDIPGYTLNAMRAYATYFLRGSSFLARQEFAEPMQASIKGIRENGSLVERDTRTKIADFVQKHYDEVSTGGTEIANYRTLTYMWYLGFVPVSAFVNMTQVPLTTLPHLASKFGDRTSIWQLARGLNSILKNKINEYKTGKVLDEGFKTEARNQGNTDRYLTDGLATELAAVSNGGAMQRLLPGTDMARKMRSLASGASWMFSTVEAFNRNITFSAALDLALAHPDVPYIEEVAGRNGPRIGELQRDLGWTEPQARAYMAAVDAVTSTQFQYSKTYRPAIARGQVGAFLFLLKNYNLNMTNFAFRSDKGTMARFWFLMAGSAGLMGLPGAEDATKLIKMVASQLGYRIDFEAEIRDLMKGFSEGNLADYALHGASRNSFGFGAAASGLGLPFPAVDLSRNLSLGRLIPGLSAGLDAWDAKSKMEFLGKTTEDILGPGFGIPWNLFQALTDHSLLASDPKRWERAMPRGARELVRASRYLAEGKERERGDGTIAPFDTSDPQEYMEALTTGLGFNPTRVNQAYDLIAAQKNVEQYWTLRKTALMGNFYRALRVNDPEGRTDAIDAIKAFNKEVPFKEMGIKSQSLKQGFKSQVIQALYKQKHLSPDKSKRRLSAETLSGYPEVSSGEVD